MRNPDVVLSLEKIAGMASHPDYDYGSSHSHSRESSGASDCASPATPTFSLTEHSRSVSSLASTPPCEFVDSPSLPVKSVLHDLVEDPSERDETCSYYSRARDSSVCNDDSDFYALWPSRTWSRSSWEWDAPEEAARAPSEHYPDSPRRRRGSPAGGEEAGPPVTTTLKSRLSQRIPSLSQRLRERRSYSSLSFQGVRSAPASRAPSIRSPIHPAGSAVDITDFAAQPPVPALPSRHAELAALHDPDTVVDHGLTEDPIDRKKLASTPLLPPCFLTERVMSETGSVQSPLQSPSVVEPNGFAFPDMTATPPAASVQSALGSRKTSVASFSALRGSQVRSSADMQVSVEKLKLADAPADVWADKLGHANFEILPAPYAPIGCDLESCRQLTEDWELARKRYLHHAATVSEDFGPTSQTFKLTEEKWADTDAQWKQHFDLVIARAKSCGVNVAAVPCLADTSGPAKLSSMEAPDTKALALADNGEIVGPMVTYVSRIKPQSKKNAFRRFFSDLRTTGN